MIFIIFLVVPSARPWKFLELGQNHLVLKRWGLRFYIKGKGKAIPLQAWTGPEVSRRLRLPDFKTIGT